MRALALLRPVTSMVADRFNANQFVSDFERAFNTKDFQAVLKYYDANVEFTDPDGRMQRGLDAFRKSWESWIQGFSETKISLTQAVQSGNDVALLQSCKGRHTGEFEIMPGERIPATNKNIDLVVAEFIRLNDQGKIVRDVGVMDSAILMKQLGILPTGIQEGGQRRTVQR